MPVSQTDITKLLINDNHYRDILKDNVLKNQVNTEYGLNARLTGRAGIIEINPYDYELSG